MICFRLTRCQFVLSLVLGLQLLLASVTFAQTQQEIDEASCALGRPVKKSTACSYWAGVEEGKGHYETAIGCYRNLLQIYAEDPSVGVKSAKYGWVLTRIAICEKERGNLPLAKSLCKQALSVASSVENNECNSHYLNEIKTNCAEIFGKAVQSTKSLARSRN